MMHYPIPTVMEVCYVWRLCGYVLNLSKVNGALNICMHNCPNLSKLQQVIMFLLTLFMCLHFQTDRQIGNVMRKCAKILAENSMTRHNHSASQDVRQDAF